LLSDKTKVSINSQSSPLKLHLLEGRESCVVAFGSDVPYLLPLGTPLLVGPGSILDAHTDHEKVKKTDLEDAVLLYADLVTVLLK
jgi:acetylornithine deacetylase